MTLQDAIRMMGTTVSIAMESDQKLADDIAMRQKVHVEEYEAKNIKKKLKLAHKSVITPAAGVQGEMKVRPISAMLELARGTALNADPEVAAFARRWSTLRHLGIFDMNDEGKLRLDAATLQFIGPNQRRVLSEDLGIGFGILVAKHWCQERMLAFGLSRTDFGPITAIDVDIALRNGAVPNLKTSGERQPDYLLAYSSLQNPGMMVYEVLETKGTVDRSTAKKQLGRAVTQLAGLTVGGQTMTGIAVSTVSTVNGVLAMAVDPEELPMTWRPTNDVLEHWRTAEMRQWEDAVEVNISAEEFFATATNVDNASLAEFSGQHGLAKRWLPNLDADRGREVNTEVRRTTDAGSFVGTEFVMEIPGSSERVRIYHGVEESVVDALREVDGIAVASAQRAFAQAHGVEVEMLPEITGNSVIVSAVSSDGSMMEIGIS